MTRALLVGMFVLAACGSTPAPIQPYVQAEPQPNTAVPEIVGTWYLYILAGRVVDDPSLTLTLRADGTFEGRSPCNHYGGAYVAGADTAIAITDFISTEAACADPARQQIEIDLYRVLNQTDKFRTSISGTDIRFLTPDGPATVFVAPDH